MWQLWELNGKYIQGNLVIEHSSKAAIISEAKKRLGKDIKLIEDNRKDEKIIWIDSANDSCKYMCDFNIKFCNSFAIPISFCFS